MKPGKVCPTCKKRYDVMTERCPVDGAVLRWSTAGVDPLLGTSIDGRYELRAIAGEGNMSRVYVAHQASMGRDVAIKVLHTWHAKREGAAQRFLHEARAASRLVHPHTIRVFDFGKTADGCLFMVQELLSGRALSEIIEAEAPLPARRALRMAIQLCDALAEAHDQGIVHRDLKPDNVLVEKVHGHEDFLKILDFGVAKIDEAGAAESSPAVGIIGTPSYMSPEQAHGADVVDGRTDIYALGCVLFELLTGRRAFDGVQAMEVLMKQISSPAPPLPEALLPSMPPAMPGILARMLAKDRAERYPNCTALRHDLQAALDAAPVAPPKPMAAPPQVPSNPAVITADFGVSPTRRPTPTRRGNPTPSRGAAEEPRNGTTPRGEPAPAGTAQVAPPPAPPPAVSFRGPAPPPPAPLPPAPVTAPPPSASVPAPSPPPVKAALRPAALGLREPASGRRFDLVAVSATEGVLMAQPGPQPSPGTWLRLAGADAAHHGVQLTGEVLAPDGPVASPGLVRVRWTRAAARTADRLVRLLTEVFGLAGAVIPSSAGRGDGLLPAWDFRHHRADADEAFDEPAPSPTRTAEPRKPQRRVLEITTTRGVDKTGDRPFDPGGRRRS